ncbi:hypothetical protein PILCRDRAFT_810957, partial [Piloderma croceum F 1598]
MPPPSRLLAGQSLKTAIFLKTILSGFLSNPPGEYAVKPVSMYAYRSGIDSTEASGWPVELTGILYEVGNTGLASPIANYVPMTNVAVHEKLRGSPAVVNFTGPIYTSMNVSWDSPLLILY